MLVNLYTTYHISEMFRQWVQNTGKPNKLLSIMTVCRDDFHNSVMANMLQFG